MIDPAAFKDIIKAHVDAMGEESRGWDRMRAMYRCEQMRGEAGDAMPAELGTDGDVMTETGALFAYTDTMVSTVVPPNPQVTARAKREAHRVMAKFREALVNDVFYRRKVRRALWQLATLAAIYPRAFLKVVWDHRDNFPRFLPVDPRHVYYDLGTGEWGDIRYLVEATVLTRGEFESRVRPRAVGRMPADPRKVYDAEVARKARFDAYPRWLKRAQDGTNPTRAADKSLDVFKWVVVYECWDFTDPVPRYYHFLADQKEPLYAGPPPYKFVRNPFWLVKFNENLEDTGGYADSTIIESPVRRLDELRTLELRFAQATIPVTVLDRSNVDDADAARDKLAECTSPADVLDIDIKNDKSIKDVLGQTPTAQLSPAFGSAKQGLEQEILFRLGMPQYTRGVTGTSDVATELALVDSALRTRQGRRSEVINDCLWHAARCVVGLYEQFMAADSTLPARLVDGKVVDLDRQGLGLREPVEADVLARDGKFPEDALDIDYVAIPYSPTEDSKTAQLRRMSEFLKVLVGNPEISQSKLMARLSDLLDLGDLTLSPEERQAMAAQQQPPVGGPPVMPGGPALPPGAPPSPEGGTPLPGKGGGLPMGIEFPPGVNTGIRQGMAGGAGNPLPNGLR